MLSNNWTNGMDFANCIDANDHSREGSVRIRAAWLTFAQILPADPSRKDSPVVVQLAKPIPWAQLFDDWATAPNELILRDLPFGLKPNESLHQLPRA